MKPTLNVCLDDGPSNSGRRWLRFRVQPALPQNFGAMAPGGEHGD
jgi:hypothetical protein